MNRYTPLRLRRSYRPNKSAARVKAGRRSGEKRSERKDELLYNVEGYDATLIPLARKWDHKIPAHPENMSRFEYFLQLVDDDPDAAIIAADKAAESYIRELSRGHRQSEHDVDPHEFLDEFFEDKEDDEEPSAEEIESFIMYLDDVLSEREIGMLNRVIGKEGMSSRQLKCFYFAARKRIVRNGTMWL